MTASPTDDLASAEHRIQELTEELSQARGELSQARGELAEARDQQAATAEILRAISTSSPTDPQRVFAMIAASAARLSDAYDALVLHADGDVPSPCCPRGAASHNGSGGTCRLALNARRRHDACCPRPANCSGRRYA